MHKQRKLKILECISILQFLKHFEKILFNIFYKIIIKSMPHTLENKEYTALLSGENATVLDAYAFPEKDASKAQTEADMEQEFIETLVSQSYEYAAHIKTEDDLKANLRLQLEKLNEVSFSEKEWNFLWKTHISNPSEDMRVKTKKMQVD